jgi:hypothetical protein
MRTISLDLHDGSILRTRYDLLDILKEHFPKLKVSLFWIPYDYIFEMGQIRTLREDKLQEIKKRFDWIELIPHGISHLEYEFAKCSCEVMEMYVNNIEKEFTKDGLTMVKGFCAPNWLWTQDCVDVLNEHNWFGATDRNQPDMIKPRRNYIYTHSIAEPFWEEKEQDLRLHGHIDGVSDNDLEKCIVNMMKMPRDAEFKFVSEVINETL